MTKAELKLKAELTKKYKAYKKELEKNKLKLAKLKDQLTKERNREQYLKRCISAIATELGHQKAGQLTFKT